MMRRIFTLTGYLLRSLTLSLSGLLFVLLTLAYWRVFFDPTQRTPEVAYYILLVGLFGAALTFLVTLTVCSRANQAVNYPLLARLPSRVEYLTAVFLAAILFATLLQLLLALLATWRGPALSPGRVLEMPPIWLSANVLAAVLSLHATDLVTKGWSRVVVYSVLAVLLFVQNANQTMMDWLAGRVNNLSAWFFTQNINALGNAFNTMASWLAGQGLSAISRVVGIIFWPFHAIADATIAGAFTQTQALAPGILLLYATVLFMLAADLFATKNLFLTE